MNYGKYFRLNLKESKVVDGVSVYDYIDLPAYFGPSKSMSPKYPISVVISRDSIRFRLHYCAYKYELDDAKEIMYKYDPFEKLSEAIEDDIRTIHMQEVILELPIYNINEDSLANIIRKIYCSRFPQLTEDDANLFKEGFLNQLLKKRYGHDYDLDLYDSPLEQDSYRSLRANNDSDRSYSTIWLMDLQKNDGQTKYIELDSNRISIQKPKSILSLFARKTNTQNSRLLLDDGSYLTWEGEAALEVGTPVSLTGKEKLVPFDNGRNEILRAADILIDIEDGKVKRLERIPRYESFLRKLLLDFMFDLAHSDVFQNSPNYTETYSGLMSDAMFSSLMHKCEYYYYRGLTIDALEEIEIGEESRKSGVEERIKQIKMLYATHLFEAEKKWVEDIMNPSSDRLFDIPRDDFASDPQRIKNWDSFKIYDYWFAPPEEEMRRICFTTYSSNIEAYNKSFFKRLKDRKLHLCNADTLAEYLSIDNRDAIQSVRTRISQWFFKRYDFADALHLHAFRNFSLIEFVLILAVIIAVIAFPRFIEQAFWKDLFTNKVRIISVLLCALLVITSSFLAFTKGWGAKLFRSKHVLWLDHISLVWKRVFNYLVGVLGVVVIPIIAGSSSWNPTLKIIVALISWAIFAVILIRGHWITNIHILYPRLLASITTAWLSLAIGNELFSAFFDSVPSVYSCVLLSLVVLLFLIYEINRQLPYVKRGEKFWRSVQMLVYSYGISLIVGLFIINFTGERFLERSEYLPTYYEEYSEVPNSLSSTNELGFTAESETVISYSHTVDKTNGAPKDSIILTTTIGKAEIASQSQLTNRELLKGLRNKKIPNGNHPVVTVWDIGGYEFFILRDLLIQFAFLAMFIGVFIQMIFEEKSITEM